MWICIQIVNYSNNIAKIDSLKIELSRVSFVDYLPQIYRGGGDKNSFLSRFLFVFQSLYTDLEEKIADMPVLFDPVNVDSTFLDWLIQWLSIKDKYIWGEEKLRILLENAIELYKIKGTKESIKKIVEIYTGQTPLIVEQFEVIDNDNYHNSKESVENLFGKNGYVFSVIMKENKEISSSTYTELMKLINRFKPIDTICNLVVLDDVIHLGHHCYLGINSCISSSDNMVLEDKSKMLTQLMLVNADKQ